MSRSCIDGYEMYTKRERTFGRRILGVCEFFYVS